MNTHNVFVDTSNAGDVLLVQPVPQTKKQKRIRTLFSAGIHHFKMDERLGLNPLFHCWCGSSLELDYIEHGYEEMSHMLMQFVDEHNECPAPEPKANA